MDLSRRRALAVMGAVAILPACTTAPDPAAAWRNPGRAETDPRRRAFAWGILAPNPHDMQPWLLDLSRPGVARVFVHPDRLLPVTDPFDRQITIGTGAMLELTRLAAERDGWRAQVVPAPDGEPATPRLGRACLAEVRFTPVAPAADPLLAHALARRTNRSAFADTPVSPAQVEAVLAAARTPGVEARATTAPADLAPLRTLVYRGAEIEAHTRTANDESCDRTFIGARAVAEHRYGIALRGPAIELAHAAGLLTTAKMKAPGSWAFDQALAFLKTAADSAQGFVWLTTPDNTRAAQLAAGAAYLRAGLAATGAGLALHPWSQVLQEYPTMATAYAEAHRRLAPAGGRVQMFARIGAPKETPPPAPRRGLDAQVLRA